MRIAPTCPHCHQPYRESRFSIRLGPRKAAIVDAIHAAGDAGISTAELVTALYPDAEVSENLIRQHVFQINSLFEEIDWRIVSDGRAASARWRFVKRGRK
jgi:hypothetical protein